MEIYIIIGVSLLLVTILYVILNSKKRNKNESEALHEIGESDPKRDYYVL